MFGCNLPSVWPAIVTLSAILAALCVSVAMLLRERRLRLEQRHAERMKALEMGATLPDLDPPREHAAFISNAFWMAFWLGFAAPVFTVIAAARATGAVEGLGYVLAIWISTAAVCIAGAVCATVIVLRSRPRF